MPMQPSSAMQSALRITSIPTPISRLPLDVLTTRLDGFVEAGQFTGRYHGPTRDAIEERFEKNLAQIFARAETPRLSGVQIKAPMHLAADGALSPAIDLPFTHILKPAGTAGFEMLPIVEWLCLQLGRTAGFATPDIALTPMPDGMSPALLVERFDIRQSTDDRRRSALEDFCSVLDLPASAKYDGTMERMARGLRPLLTDPAADLAILFRRSIFAWLIADGDMHLKNLALLKIAEPGAKVFTSVRFAPLHDAVTTRVFPGLGSDRMALKLNAKDDRLSRGDFLAAARTIGLAEGKANAALTELVERVEAAAPNLRLPAFAGGMDGARAIRNQMVSIIADRCTALAPAR
jgi:serine/threonine-protein kinase HipA